MSKNTVLNHSHQSVGKNKLHGIAKHAFPLVTKEHIHLIKKHVNINSLYVK